ncbi:MAG: hypothetical protein RIQ66_896 [Pseudomonadota bacterium]
MLSRKDLFLLSLLTFFWGINWPVMKYAVLTYPPMAFRGISMVLGILAIGLYMMLRKDHFYVPPQERGPILKLVIGNMLIWHLFAMYAIKFLTSGRAAIIGYTMPVWAMLIGVLFYKNPLTLRGAVGVLLALIATLLLAIEEFSSLIGQPLGLGMMLIAAIGWGLGTVMMNRTQLTISNASLTFWMMVATVVVVGLVSVVLEIDQWRAPTPSEWATILYNALLVFGFCHIIWFRLARKLPPIASSLSIMLIPVLGVFSGAWALNETIGPYDISALILILIAMAVVLLPRRKSSQESVASPT